MKSKQTLYRVFYGTPQKCNWGQPLLPVEWDHAATPSAYRSAINGSKVLHVFAALVKAVLTKMSAAYTPAKGCTHWYPGWCWVPEGWWQFSSADK